MLTKKLLVPNELQHLPHKLEEPQFLGRCVDDCQLQSTNIYSGHGSIIHGRDSPNSFDVGCSFLTMGLGDFEVELVALFLHLGWFGRTTEMGQ
jgi:hypothetical protein